MIKRKKRLNHAPSEYLQEQAYGESDIDTLKAAEERGKEFVDGVVDGFKTYEKTNFDKHSKEFVDALYGTKCGEQLSLFPQEDPVNYPGHYTQYSLEVKDAIYGLSTPDEFRGAMKFNSIKYITRYQQKGGIQDLEKAIFLLKELIRREEEWANETSDL